MANWLIKLFGGYTAEELATAVAKKEGELTPLPVPDFVGPFPTELCSCHEHGWFTQTYGGFYSKTWVLNDGGWETHRFLKSWLEGLQGAVPTEIPWVKMSVTSEGCPCGTFGGASTAQVLEGTTLQDIETWVKSFDPYPPKK